MLSRNSNLEQFLGEPKGELVSELEEGTMNANEFFLKNEYRMCDTNPLNQFIQCFQESWINQTCESYEKNFIDSKVNSYTSYTNEDCPNIMKNQTADELLSHGKLISHHQKGLYHSKKYQNGNYKSDIDYFCFIDKEMLNNLKLFQGINTLGLVEDLSMSKNFLIVNTTLDKFQENIDGIACKFAELNGTKSSNSPLQNTTNQTTIELQGSLTANSGSKDGLYGKYLSNLRPILNDQLNLFSTNYKKASQLNSYGKLLFNNKIKRKGKNFKIIKKQTKRKNFKLKNNGVSSSLNEIKFLMDTKGSTLSETQRRQQMLYNQQIERFKIIQKQIEMQTEKNKQNKPPTENKNEVEKHTTNAHQPRTGTKLNVCEKLQKMLEGGGKDNSLMENTLEQEKFNFTANQVHEDIKPTVGKNLKSQSSDPVVMKLDPPGIKACSDFHINLENYNFTPYLYHYIPISEIIDSTSSIMPMLQRYDQFSDFVRELQSSMVKDQDTIFNLEDERLLANFLFDMKETNVSNFDAGKLSLEVNGTLL